MGLDLTPEEFAHWIHKEMQNNRKHNRQAVPWLLAVMATMKERPGADLVLDHARVWAGLSLGH